MFYPCQSQPVAAKHTDHFKEQHHDLNIFLNKIVSEKSQSEEWSSQ